MLTTIVFVILLSIFFAVWKIVELKRKDREIEKWRREMLSRFQHPDRRNDVV